MNMLKSLFSENIGQGSLVRNQMQLIFVFSWINVKILTFIRWYVRMTGHLVSETIKASPCLCFRSLLAHMSIVTKAENTVCFVIQSLSYILTFLQVPRLSCEHDLIVLDDLFSSFVSWQFFPLVVLKNGDEPVNTTSLFKKHRQSGQLFCSLTMYQPTYIFHLYIQIRILHFKGSHHCNGTKPVWTQGNIETSAASFPRYGLRGSLH